ncbi:unnamed protein product [Symbiodinium sp. KB8]|nr:unnamed protein product [Symbiodinium sp. KB8]
MPAVDLHGRDGFALLARAFVELGAIRNTSRLCQRSAPAMWHPPWHRGGAGGGPGEFGVVAPRPRRDRVIDRRARQRSLGYQLNTGPPGGLGRGNGDVAGDGWPAGRRDGARGRGSATRGLPADGVICRYGGTQEALADIDENVLARSSQGPFQSRVRTWVDLCQAWAVEPWPISLEAIRSVAASLRRGGYRSAQNYFDAGVAYQERFREQAVDPLLKKAMRRYTWAAVFPVDSLAALVVIGEVPATLAWSPWTSAHAADDLEATGGTVTLRVPLHKAATGGQTELTMRQLRCACRSAVSPLCPYHSAVRHMERLKAAGVWFRDRPLFPDSSGETWEKSSAILLFRRVLMAAGIQTTAVDHTGAPVQLFGGHLARVAGASWLASKGVPTPVIQLLGRWSSAAVERYIQAAPLALAPEVPHRVLHQASGCTPPTLEVGHAVAQAPPAPAAQAPAIMDVASNEQIQASRQETSPAEFSPVVDFVPHPKPDPAALAAATGAAPEHYIYNAKALRVHAADPAEATADRFLWKTKGCSWPYGVRAFYRITDKPADAAWCLRCFPQFRDKPAPGSPTEEAESPVASSSASADSSESSD